jgi:hypothetical protein
VSVLSFSLGRCIFNLVQIFESPLRRGFQMLGVFVCRVRARDDPSKVMAGLSRAKSDGTQLGRRRLEDSDAIVAARANPTHCPRARVGVGTVLRLTGEAA